MSGFSQLNPVPVANGGTGGTTSTGSGAVVLATSPALLTAATINGLSIANNASAGLSVASNKTFTVSNTLTLTGTDGSSISLGPVGQVPGIATSTAASAGNIGEIITSDIPVGSPISLSSGVETNITSITLTAGDWDVRGSANIVPGASDTVTMFRTSLSTTTGTIDLTLGRGATISYPTGSVISSFGVGLQISPKPFTVTSGTTVVYLVVRCNFGVSANLNAYGNLIARRVR